MKVKGKKVLMNRSRLIITLLSLLAVSLVGVAYAQEPAEKSESDLPAVGTTYDTATGATVATASVLPYVGELCPEVVPQGAVPSRGYTRRTSIIDFSEADIYYFDADAGDLVVIEVHRLTYHMDPVTWLFRGFDSPLTFVASADDNNGIPHGVGGSFADPRIVYSVSTAGTYTLAVWDYLGAGPSPTYEIHISGITCNEPPTADAGGPYLVAVNESIITLDGSASDPDGDALSLLWAAEDGSFDDASLEAPVYTAGSEAGIFDLSLTATDPGGLSDTAGTYVVVYDPSAGFVTGGGWIDSPAGAYAKDNTLAGKANFGFVSKYKKGADTPTGNTEFQFKAADLNFHSSSYDWLVVTGSDYAMFKGVGTINGEGEYKFKLWAGDGTGTDGADTFRIRIWTEDELGVETDEYDNGMDQDIGGGSIVVHTKNK